MSREDIIVELKQINELMNENFNFLINILQSEGQIKYYLLDVFINNDEKLTSRVVELVECYCRLVLKGEKND